jgi:hypothetical protein
VQRSRRPQKHPCRAGTLCASSARLRPRRAHPPPPSLPSSVADTHRTKRLVGLTLAERRFALGGRSSLRRGCSFAIDRPWGARLTHAWSLCALRSRRVAALRIASA